MKKIILAAVAVLFSAAAYANSTPIGEAFCRFEGESGKHEVECRVKVRGGVPSERTPSCFPVDLEIECSNGFELEDEYATAFFRNEGRDGLVVGIEHDRTAVIRVDLRDFDRNERLDAELTIREDDWAVALEGSCRIKTGPGPAPVPMN